MLLTRQHSEPVTGVLEDSFHWENSETSPGHRNYLYHCVATTGGYDGPVNEKETGKKQQKVDQEERNLEEKED